MKTQGTTLQIDSPKKPRNRVKPTPFDRYYRGRTRLSAAKFTLSGGKSGSQAPKVLTYERWTVAYQRGTRENSTGIYLGTAPTC